jgi:hypothetical protein
MGSVPKCEIAIDYEYNRFTHPLPPTVLTVSKRDVPTFEQSPWLSVHSKIEDSRNQSTMARHDVQGLL